MPLPEINPPSCINLLSHGCSSAWSRESAVSPGRDSGAGLGRRSRVEPARGARSTGLGASCRDSWPVPARRLTGLEGRSPDVSARHVSPGKSHPEPACRSQQSVTLREAVKSCKTGSWRGLGVTCFSLATGLLAWGNTAQEAWASIGCWGVAVAATHAGKLCSSQVVCMQTQTCKRSPVIRCVETLRLETVCMSTRLEDFDQEADCPDNSRQRLDDRLPKGSG